jgi:flagellar biosynthesis chaperone FliJ
MHPFEKRRKAEQAKLQATNPNKEEKVMSKKNPSRRERFEHAMSLVEDAKVQIEELKDELQDWLDNLPENLQNGTKADELNEAISELDDAINDLETASGHEVNFPGAFGK